MPETRTERSSRAKTVVVVGVGYTGRRILERLPTAAATGLSRSAVHSPRPTAVLDLDAASELPIRLPDTFDVIYTVPPARSTAEDLRLQTLLDLLEPPPGRFVYISTSGVYGNHDGAWVDEATPPSPGTPRAKRRQDAEQRLTAWGKRRSVEIVILRAPGIYGPGRLGIERIRRGTPILVEADANPGNRIHVDDLAASAIRALSRAVPPGVFNVGDGDQRSSTWFVHEVARQIGLPTPPTVSRSEAEKTFSRQRLSFLAESRRVDTTKMREVLGFVPQYGNAEDGIRASLAEES